jgi:YbgC/YbaW family acyl-CoA thioester hydrolase
MKNTVFEYTRRVAFAETDAAGIAHFSQFPRWVEEAETAFWRAHGVETPSVEGARLVGWPKVSFSIRYRSPVRCGDEVVVAVEPRVLAAGTISWRFRVSRGKTVCATGTMVVVLAEGEPLRGSLKTRAMPAEMLSAVEEGKITNYELRITN